VPRTSPAWPDDKRFLGKPVDTPTGLTHIGAREYDPGLGRFLSVDPLMDLSNGQTLNGYAYSANNPTTFSDPTGLELEQFGGGGFSGGGSGGGGGSAGGGSSGGGSSYVSPPPSTPDDHVTTDTDGSTNAGVTSTLVSLVVSNLAVDLISTTVDTVEPVYVQARCRCVGWPGGFGGRISSNSPAVATAQQSSLSRLSSIIARARASLLARTTPGRNGVYQRPRHPSPASHQERTNRKHRK